MSKKREFSQQKPPVHIDNLRFVCYAFHIEVYPCEVCKVENTTKAKIFKAFCDENRLTILDLLRSGEKCACSLLEELKITQSTLSHHMKILCESGIVSGRKEGKWTHYTINVEGLGKAQYVLDEYSQISNRETKQSC
jgi:ArsR family transcriptional regulator